VKVSVATTIRRSRGGQFVVHAMALPGKPHDGHTLRTVLPEIERLVGAPVQRVLTDAGYRGHKLPSPWKFRVFVDGQKRRVTKAIKRLMKRRAAVEPVIGHLKAEHRMGRNYLAHRMGDAINAILAAAGYNIRLLRRFIVQPFCVSFRYGCSDSPNVRRQYLQSHRANCSRSTGNLESQDSKKGNPPSSNVNRP